jgi:hypothetical protein
MVASLAASLAVMLALNLVARKAVWMVEKSAASTVGK